MKLNHPSGDQHWMRRMPERVLRGPAAPGAKLTSRQIARLHELRDANLNNSEIARILGVSRITVWRHLKSRNT